MSVRSHADPSTPEKPSKRAAILRAALQVFAEYGVHGVPVPEIAKRAGVATGTIYRFFDSKEALVNEVYREQKRELGKRLATIDVTQSPRAIFDVFWEKIVAFVREEPDAFRFLELQDHHSYLDEESRALERRVLAPMAAMNRDLQRRGIFRRDIRPEVAMALYWGAIVNLFKAEGAGFLRVQRRDVVAARDACWRMCAAPTDDVPKRARRSGTQPRPVGDAKS